MITRAAPRSATAVARLETQARLRAALLDVCGRSQHHSEERPRRRRLHEAPEIAARPAAGHDGARGVKMALDGLREREWRDDLGASRPPDNVNMWIRWGPAGRTPSAPARFSHRSWGRRCLRTLSGCAAAHSAGHQLCVAASVGTPLELTNPSPRQGGQEVTHRSDATPRCYVHQTRG